MPAPVSTTTMTPSMTAMLAVLSAERGATVIALSERAELGRSTAARVLSTLEGKGLARRVRAEGTGDHRAPDLWFATAPDASQRTQAEPAATALDDEPGTDTADTEPGGQQAPDAGADLELRIPRSEAQAEPEDEAEPEDARAEEPAPKVRDEPEPNAADQENVDLATRVDCGDRLETGPAASPDAATDAAGGEQAPEAETGRAAPQQVAPAAAAAGSPEPDARTEATRDAASTAAAGDTTPTAVAPTSAAGATVRLAKGGLRALVAAHLQAYPSEEFTGARLGKILGRSSGAVANVFDTLVKSGEAQMTCEKPRTFRHLAKAAH